MVCIHVCACVVYVCVFALVLVEAPMEKKGCHHVFLNLSASSFIEAGA